MLERAHLAAAMAAAVLFCLAAVPAGGQPSFITFESGQVRPLALSPDGTLLFATNTPDNTLEIFDVDASGITHTASVQVGMEPVAVNALSNTEVWVVNHLSDSVSVVQLGSEWGVTRTLLLGDEPRDVVFTDPDDGGPLNPRAFVTTAHRGQHRTNPTISGVTGAGDPQLSTPSVDRADVWVFDTGNLGTALGGTPLEIVTLFGDTPRALAVSDDGDTIYAAVFHSGNQTAVVPEGLVCENFGSSSCLGDGYTSPNGRSSGRLPHGVPGPNQNHAGANAPEIGLIVQFDNAQNRWEHDACSNNSCNWDNGIRFYLPDYDVFEIDATSLNSSTRHSHVGTILFNMAVNPVNGNVYVSNTDAQNLTRFEGPGTTGGSTVQGNLAQSRITVITQPGGTVEPRHLNRHIDYGTLPAPAGTKSHSLATPTDMVISSNGSTLYTAAFGSSRVGVFDTADLENDSLWTTPYPGGFDPTTESANYLSVSGGGPSGLALDETHNRLYVLTRFDNSVSVIDLGSGSEVNHIPLHNPEPTSVTDGRFMLYDANATSSNGEASCSSCHIFGDFDSLAWDLGDPDGDVITNPTPINFGTLLQFFPGGSPPELNGTGNVTDLHPMKGPMTTQTLRGMTNSGSMHWRGDRAVGFFGTDFAFDEDLNFRNFIVAFEGLIGMDVDLSAGQGNGGPAELQLESDMQLFSDFILQVALPPNPIRALDNGLTTAQQAGFDFFMGNTGQLADGSSQVPGFSGFTCNGCHSLAPSAGFFGTGGLASFENEPQIVKIPHLRNMYQKVGMFGMGNVAFNNSCTAGSPCDPGGIPVDNTHQGDQVRGTGFLHDGGTDTLFRFFQATVFNNPSIVDGSPTVGFNGGDTQRRNVEQFMFAFDSDLAPVVGQQVTVTSTTPLGPTDDVPVRIALLETRAGTTFDSAIVNQQPGNVPVTECDLVVTGRDGSGDERGYLYDPVANNYDPDRASEPVLSQAALLALAATAGQELTFTCAPPGSGTRMALDRDEDGVFDTDEVDAGTQPDNPASFVGACNDGKDNDGDGQTDWPNDPGCRNPNWHIENPECSDGYDNDNDGLADAADSNCIGKPYKKGEDIFSLCGLLGIEPFAMLGLMHGYRRLRRRARAA